MNENKCNQSCRDYTMLPIKGFGLAVDTSALECCQAPEVMDLRFDRETKLPGHFYLGKQVYARLVDWGPLPNASLVRKPHNIENMDWFMIDPVYSSIRGVSSGNMWNFPMIDAGSSKENVEAGLSPTEIMVTTGIDRSAANLVVCIRYTKTTDTPLP